MPRIDEIEHSFNALFYGEPGSGKTHLAGSACLVPEMCPIVWFDTEKGILTVKSAFRGHEDKFIYERVTNFQQLSDGYKKLERGDGKTYTDAEGTEHPWPKTVVIDNMSETQKVMMRRIMEAVVKEDSSRDVEVPSKREWGKVLEQMRITLRSFRDLEMNTIMTAWAYTEEDKGRKITYPGLQGKMGKDIAGYIDVVGYLYEKTEDGKMQRKMLTERFNNTIAKVRGDGLPKPVLEEPTMEKIWHGVMG